MSARALGRQFAVYQPPLPGTEAPAHPAPGSRTVPVSDVFPHPQIDKSRAEYHLTMNYSPQHVRVRASALRPTQDVLDEGTLHSPRASGDIGAIKDTKGRYRLVDGHHKVAHALMTGQTHVDALVWHEGRR